MKKGGTCSRLPLMTDYNTPQARWWPSCYNHQTDEEREKYVALLRREQERNEAAWTADPACWSWPVPSPLPRPKMPTGISDATAARITAMYDSTAESLQAAQLEEWQAGRCAICGGGQRVLVEDHDHTSGLVRGWLCRSCNTREGSSRRRSTAESGLAKYRRRPPAVMLGVHVRYWNPFTQDYAPQLPPLDRAQSRAENPWLKVQDKRRKAD